ncbi:SRPBCC family protein [Bradyrhizobium sp. U87765 SZCCT0131]|uniref:SRPBCC family protein n=1 Tax=unclassified Bradyrhizobium TaxID=2631580 RepID=UPI001BA8F816|nr:MULTISPECIES: SRPBCC family protein [unclassified Bradyrhizobium]MBR1222205.1 SRPBCC family protein [Bradyrhizobium sp. U87765 SZCCT0131]MBR1264311.1 SRPBCC family protein [Bradyrhizobium sp. U87765 SZCCT0134]MBR1307906.1 SRPBCC family protein [Bradyrhizobium sp. U87765 SZCCT0110]MBR1320561.1 SRPBCC family protein [Bradyrhizobium sp. U87765 SZCCT0109]MBR1348326.1 SRPBCC family protein [Bradyrhizobium sp. U87765 SZCCT0048]
MSEPTATATNPDLVIHSTFTLERRYPQAPARVFFAHADAAMKRRWFTEGDGWDISSYALDFRVGGLESSRFTFQGGPEITYDSVIQDIVQDRRIVFAYRMTVAGAPISASLSTIELKPDGRGTLMRYTEQGTYFGDPNAPAGREHGSRELLEKLAAELDRTS